MPGLFMFNTFPNTGTTQSNELDGVLRSLITVSGNLKLSAEGALYRAGTGTGIVKSDRSPTTLNQGYTFWVNTKSTTGSFTIRLRQANSNVNTFYQIALNRTSAFCRLTRQISGSSTAIGADASWTPVPGALLKYDYLIEEALDGLSTRVRVWMDDVLLLDRTDNAANSSRVLVAGTPHLVFVDGSTTTGQHLKRLEGWEVGASIATVAPTQLTPADGTSPVIRPVNVEWTTSSGGANPRYRLEFYETGVGPIQPYLLFRPTTTSQEIRYDVPQSKNVEWRIRREDDDGVSPWSPLWDFTTDAPPFTISIMNGGVKVWDAGAFGLFTNFWFQAWTFNRINATKPSWVDAGHEAIGSVSTEHGNNAGEVERSRWFSFNGDVLNPVFTVITPSPEMGHETPSIMYNPNATNARPWNFFSAPDAGETARRTSADMTATSMVVENATYIPESLIPGSSSTAYFSPYPYLADTEGDLLGHCTNGGGADVEWHIVTAAAPNWTTVTRIGTVDTLTMMPNAGHPTLAEKLSFNGQRWIWIGDELWVIGRRIGVSDSGGGDSPGGVAGMIRCGDNDPYNFIFPFYDLWKPSDNGKTDNIKWISPYLKDDGHLYILVTIKESATRYDTYAFDAGVVANPVEGGDTPLEVDGAWHGHAVEELSLTQASTLVAQDALHRSLVEALTLQPAGSLAVQDAGHAHQADSVTLAVAGLLVVQEALHRHTAEAPTLSAAGATLLAVQDAIHAHSAEGAELAAAAVLTVQDALHGTAPTP